MSANKIMKCSKQTSQYCCLDFDINEHRTKLFLISQFVYNTNIRYGFTSNDLRWLGGSEIARIMDDNLMINDHEWSTKLKELSLSNVSNTKQQQHNLTDTTITSESIRPPNAGNRIVFELYWDDCPIACENFATLCANGTNIGVWNTSESSVASLSIVPFNSNNKNNSIPIGECGRPLTYKNSIIHRIVPNFIIQGGDFVFGNGSGGESIYGGSNKKFKDEKNGLNKKHNQRGILSMSNSGKNSNSSQFFITLSNNTSQCDGKHVIFGHIVSGWDVLSVIESIGVDACGSSSDGNTSNNDGKPNQLVTITDCGIYTPFYTPGQGYWYDYPNPEESYTGISSMFIVRPRIGIVVPNTSILQKFHSILLNSKTTFSSSIYSLVTINAECFNNNWDTVNEYIVELICNYSVDSIIVAPVCSTKISASTVAAKATASSSKMKQRVNDFVQIAKSALSTILQLPASSNTESFNVVEEILKMFIFESKPVDAITILKTKSWFIQVQQQQQAQQKDKQQQQLMSWQLDG